MKVKKAIAMEFLLTQWINGGKDGSEKKNTERRNAIPFLEEI